MTGGLHESRPGGASPKTGAVVASRLNAVAILVSAGAVPGSAGKGAGDLSGAAIECPRTISLGRKPGKAWEAWFESLGGSRIDNGYGVLATRTLGRLGAGTRLGGYSVVTTEDIESAAALAGGCPALRLGGGVEVGAVLEIIENPQAGTDA